MNTSKNSMKRILALVLTATVAVGALSACHTIHGAGQDVKSTGKAIERASDKDRD